MDVSRFLHEQVFSSLPNVHKHRQKAVVKVVHAACRARSACITDLGRALDSSTCDKHRIKCADRLVGNRHLCSQRLSFYRVVASRFLSKIKTPALLVDWSPIREQQQFALLRASLATHDGRAITIYERAFSFLEQGKPATHKAFLEDLASVLPAGCCPVLITDAGFYYEWWEKVRQRNWYFIGRIRGTLKVSSEVFPRWRTLPQLYPKATASPLELGKTILSRQNRFEARSCLFRGTKKGRIKKTRHGTRSLSREDKERERSWRDPWLLATNLPETRADAEALVHLYAKRMQIEESFRDSKSVSLGVGLSSARTKDIRRLHNLLLIVMLASYSLHVLGLAVRRSGKSRKLQSNTRSNKPTYSVIYLGRLLFRRARSWLDPSWSEIKAAVRAMHCRIEALQ